MLPGEAVVAGHVQADEFVVAKHDGAVQSTSIGDKRYQVMSEAGVSRLVETDACERTAPSLSEAQLAELAVLLLCIERHHGVPQDIEWCYDGGRFWIVQARPVTVAPSRGKRDVQWTRANACEVLPDLPSPQVREAICDGVGRIFREVFGRLEGPVSEIGPLSKSFLGRQYFNVDYFRHLCRLMGQKPADMLRRLGHQGDFDPEDERVVHAPARELLRCLPDLLRITGRQLVLGRAVRRFAEAARVAVDTLDHTDARSLSDAEIWALMQRASEAPARAMGVALLLAGSMASLEDLLGWIGDRSGFPTQTLLLTHLATGEKSVSSRQAFDLLTLVHRARAEERTRAYFPNGAKAFDGFREALHGTEFLAAFERFLEEYGHRGPYEDDWSLPRYREDPTPLLFTIAAQVRAQQGVTAQEILSRQEREAAESWSAFAAQTPRWQGPAVLPLARWLLARIKRLYRWRELVRSEGVRHTSALRLWHLVLAGRFAECGWIETRDDYFFLLLGEVEGAIRDPAAAAGLGAVVMRRKTELAAWRHLEMPLLMRESELPRLLRRAAANLPATEMSTLHGMCVSAGCAEGEVVVLSEPGEYARMRRGTILVASATGPSWTPLFTLAAGVIVEIGGMLSHASTVAREYGLPALVNVKDATRRLKDGDRVRLDATNGVVEIVRSPDG
jgi:pyruvate,water dikinase